MKKFLFSILAVLAVVASSVLGAEAAALTTGGLILANSLPLTIDDEYDRAAYDRIKFLFQGIDGFLVQPAYIRSEQVITNTKNSYQFETRSDLLLQQNRPLNKGVDNNDLFFATSWGLFLDNRVTTSKAQVTLQTYPNSIVFAAATTGCTYAQLEIFYNSQIQFQVGSTVFYEAYDTQRFRKVPQTQQTLATSGAGGNWSESQLRSNLVKVAPFVVLSGAAQNKIILTVPALPDTTDVAVDTNTQPTGENVLTLYFTGFTIKNGADKKEIAERLEQVGIKFS